MKEKLSGKTMKNNRMIQETTNGTWKMNQAMKRKEKFLFTQGTKTSTWRSKE